MEYFGKQIYAFAQNIGTKLKYKNKIDTLI